VCPVGRWSGCGRVDGTTTGLLCLARRCFDGLSEGDEEERYELCPHEGAPRRPSMVFARGAVTFELVPGSAADAGRLAGVSRVL